MLENYNICKLNKSNLQVNDTNIDTHNPIFSALQETDISSAFAYNRIESATQKHSDLSSETAPHMGKTVIAKRQLISGHEPQTRHDTKAD
jgi:hypothetical protein